MRHEPLSTVSHLVSQAMMLHEHQRGEGCFLVLVQEGLCESRLLICLQLDNGRGLKAGLTRR